MSAWTEELKAKVIKMYEDSEPTPETSTEIIKDIAEDVEMSPNGVRMVLVQAEVYVKKDPSKGGAKKPATGGDSDKPKRVSKEDCIAELRKAIEDREKEVDEDILAKLTGKAAQYFTSVLS